MSGRAPGNRFLSMLLGMYLTTACGGQGALPIERGRSRDLSTRPPGAASGRSQAGTTAGGIASTGHTPSPERAPSDDRPAAVQALGGAKVHADGQAPAPPPTSAQSVRPGINDKYFAPGAADAWARVFEGPKREVARHREAIVRALALTPGMVVADLGAGSGLFTRLLSDAVGEEGKVYALDIVPSFVERIGKQVSEAGLRNVQAVLGAERTTGLPANSVDLGFLCNVYHHLEYPDSYLGSIRETLRPGGTLVVIDFERIPNVSSAWVLGHVRAGKGVVSEEIRRAGFELVREHADLLKENYMMIWRAPAR
ncbi:MAG: methyltransferase domain-containing protein [Myxococcales bacterium]|nr:methyltransferase domain-containing protein [Myxococcales bacterium]